jgi:rubredoxin
VFGPAEGDADGDVEPRAAVQEIPADWSCPVCGAEKDDFPLLDDVEV